MLGVSALALAAFGLYQRPRRWLRSASTICGQEALHSSQGSLTDKISPVDTEKRAVSETDEDFAALFEASIQAKRFEKGQTVEGTIVAIGPEVAFVNVGGKGEATIDIGELKNDDGVLEVAVGDRIQATVVSTSGGWSSPGSWRAAPPPHGSSKTRFAPVFRWKARSKRW